MLKKLLAASTLLLLASCGVTEVDIEALEKDIVDEVDKQAQEEVTADCPDQVDWATGETFTCDVTFDDGSSTKAEVEMIDDEGQVNWELLPAE